MDIKGKKFTHIFKNEEREVIEIIDDKNEFVTFLDDKNEKWVVTDENFANFNFQMVDQFTISNGIDMSIKLPIRQIDVEADKLIEKYKIFQTFQDELKSEAGTLGSLLYDHLIEMIEFVRRNHV